MRIQTNGDTVDLYYPACHPAAGNSLNYPLALFLQGFEVDKSDYSQFATHIASSGFVVMVPNHKPEGRDYLAPELKQVIDIFEAVKISVNTLKFPCEWIDIKKLVLLGHSCGGITGIEAICNEIHLNPVTGYQYHRPPELAAGVFFGSNALSRQDTSTLINNINIPLGLIAGDLDTIIPPEVTQQAYEKIETLPKAFMMLQGVNHYGITDVPQPIAGPIESQLSTLEQSLAIQMIADWTILFLRTYLVKNVPCDSLFSQTVKMNMEKVKVFLEQILENS
ncbi:MAG: hypothetical protein WBA13_03280 [Microcoleaceae cyanobacterium]